MLLSIYYYINEVLKMKSIKFHGHKNMIFPTLGRIREIKKYSQQRLATKMQILGVGIDQQAISRIENDQRSVTDFELFCICKILNVTAEYLVTEFWNKNE